MRDGVPPSGARGAAAPAPAPLDALCRLACELTGAPSALVFGFEDDGALLLGSHGWHAGEEAALAARAVSGFVSLAGSAHSIAAAALADPENGEPLGSLLAVDAAGREWSAADRARLDSLAPPAAAALAARRAELARAAALAERDALRASLRAAEGRFALLGEVCALLEAERDPRESFPSVARRLVPELADYCLIDAVEPDGTLRRLARVHADPAKLPLLLADPPPPGELSERNPVVQVARSGVALLVPEVDAETRDAIALSPEHRTRLEALELRSLILAPLVAHDRVVGSLMLGLSRPDRRYTTGDLALVEDVAGRVAAALEDARLHAQARQAVRARDALLSALSHDLRNPLATILLSATMVLDMAPEDALEPWMRQNLRQVVEGVEQANRLIEGLLGAGRPEGASVALERAPVDGHDLLTTAVRLLRPLAVAHGVALHADGAGAPLPVHADGERVVQALSGLIGHAISHAGPGGAVRVKAEARGPELRFSVSRAHEGGADGGHHAVPALPVARAIAEAHGGRLWTDAPSHTVHFTLPAGAAA